MTASPPQPGVGCRTALLATAALLAAAALLVAVGLRLVLDPGCVDGCETLAFTLFFAGAPVSALFSAAAGGLPIAWPLDATWWVVAGFLVARAGGDTPGRWRRWLAAVLVALLYGLGLGLLVERA